MNLIELFDSLSIPIKGVSDAFNAVPIPDYPNFRIAVDNAGNPVLLLAVEDSQKNTRLKNIRLKHLQLVKDIKCKITENSESTFQTFTVITFLNSDRHLQQYFLQISETLVKSLNEKPTQHQVFETLNKFVEIFRALNDVPTNTAQGLWSELFLIDIADDTKTILKYWHNFPEETFDFNSGTEKIEVKSTSRFERIHTFSSEQLNPPLESQLLIASIFIRQNNNGKNIQDLVDSITAKIGNEFELIEKLNKLISKTLGNSLEQSIKIKFDYEIAKNSLRFYSHQDIKKIEEIYIPSEVSGVKYKSDLSAISQIKISELQPKEILFACFNS